MSDERRRQLPQGFVALRERNYVLYLIGNFGSQVGNWIELTAVAWIIYEMTDSPILLALNALFRVLPTIGLAVIGGAIADRMPRRALLIATECCMLVLCATMAMLAATGQLQFWHLYILNLLSGALTAFSVPARHALFGGLVPRDSIQSAVTLNSITVRSGMFLGPAIAGLLLAYGGYALPFFLNALSCLGLIAALLMMKLGSDDHQRASRKDAVTAQMMEGVRFVWNAPALRLVLCFEAASGIFGYNTTLITIIARDVLGTDARGLGWLSSAWGAGGLTAMALLVSLHFRNFERVMLIVGAIYVALWAGVGLSQWFWLTMLLTFGLGIAESFWGVARNTIAQTMVTDAMRGRVMSIVMMTTRASSQLGRVQSGFLVWLLGAPVAILVGAGIIGVAVASFWSQGNTSKRREEEEPSLFPWHP